MKRLMIGLMLLGLPGLSAALELSAAQENYCVQMGSLAVSIGEARDAQTPRSHALLLAKNAGDLSPALRTWAAGVVFWVYDHSHLRGADLYIPIVVTCRDELTQQAILELRNTMRADMRSLCEIMADIGAAIAGKTSTLTQAQSLARWQSADPQYTVRAEWYEKLVPFVYKRKSLTPTALRVAVTQQCLDDLATEVGAQFVGGVRR